jgi:hypothetical protein
MRYNLTLYSFILALTLFFAVVPVQAENVEFPLVQAMSYFPYSQNRVLDQSEVSVGLSLYYSNVYTFDLPGQTFNDFETSSLLLDVRYGITDGITLEFYGKVTSIFGGELDEFIENFHDTFNLPDNYRYDFPRDSVVYYYKDNFFHTQKRSFASPLVLSALFRFYENDTFSLKSRIALGIPLAELPGFVSDQPFLSAGLLMGVRSGIVSLETSGYISFFKTPKWLDTESIDTRIFYSDTRLTLGRFISGFIFRTSPIREGDAAHDAFQGYLGVRIGKGIELLIIEDFAPFDTTPDISFKIGVRLK